MAVFYNDISGEIVTASQSLNPIAEADFLTAEAQLHTGTGWHEYATQADLLAAIKANNWPAPTNTPASSASQAASTAASKVTSGIPDLFNLTFGNTTGLLGRILKVVFGGILVIVGTLRLTGANKTLTSVVKGAVV